MISNSNYRGLDEEERVTRKYQRGVKSIHRSDNSEYSSGDSSVPERRRPHAREVTFGGNSRPDV